MDGVNVTDRVLTAPHSAGTPLTTIAD
jgi:hypothetical protein